MDLRAIVSLRDGLKTASEGSDRLDLAVLSALEMPGTHQVVADGPTRSLDAALKIAFARVPGLVSYTITGAATGPTVVEFYTRAMPLDHAPGDYIIKHESAGQPALAVTYAVLQALARLTRA